MDKEVVWLHEQRRFGFLVYQMAFYSIVLIQDEDGIWGEVLIENNDYDIWNERAIEFEPDDE